MAKDSAEKKRQPHPNKQKDKRPKVACIGIKKNQTCERYNRLHRRRQNTNKILQLGIEGE